MLVSAAPVSAGNYAFSADLSQPTITNGILAAMNILDVAQSGAVMYATTSTGRLYKSSNSGATWAPANTTLVGTPGRVAVAPDDPTIVAYVNTVANRVYLSTNGGITFGILTLSATTTINAISISPLTTNHYIAIGGIAAGVTSIEYWTMGVAAPVWTALAIPPKGIDSTVTLAFSTNFAADACLLVVGVDNTTGARGVFVDVYSLNLLAWNPLGYGFPRTVVSTLAAACLCPRAQIVLDANFYVGDASTQVGFIGADITNAGTQVGGVFRLDVSGTGTLTQIYNSAIAINSVAWDGTNLMAGRRAAGPVTVLRCPNALATAGWSFIANSGLGTPGTGTLPLVMFNGGTGYCFSTGTNNAVAKTNDLGKTFQGTALVNSNYTLISDYWVSPTGAVTYVLAADGTDMVLWKKAGTTWTRMAIIAGGNAQPWMVRADKDNPDSVYLGLQLATNFWKSTDGDINWIARAASANIQDFVVQDANTLFVATTAATASVVKSINGAFTWTTTFTGLAAFADTCYSITLVGDNQLVVGGKAGLVAYTADVVTWAVIPSALAGIGVGSVVATASGLATGSTIWAGENGLGNLGFWTIGTNTALTGWTMAAAPFMTTVDGISMPTASCMPTITPLLALIDSSLLCSSLEPLQTSSLPALPMPLPVPRSTLSNTTPAVTPL